MSNKELARLRTHALYTGAAEPVVLAFEAARKARAAQARLTRKKAKAFEQLAKANPILALHSILDTMAASSAAA
jgi:hypothetical protein